MENLKTEKFESLETSPEAATSAEPLQIEKPKTEGKWEERLGTAAGFAKGFLESEPSKLLTVISLIGFIVVAFAGYMRSWAEVAIYLSFLIVTPIYFLIISLITGEKTIPKISLSPLLRTILLIGGGFIIGLFRNELLKVLQTIRVSLVSKR